MPVDLISSLAEDNKRRRMPSPKSSCDICKRRGQVVEADYRCGPCEQHMCDDCKDYHMKAKGTSLHEVFLLPLYTYTNTANESGTQNNGDFVLNNNSSQNSSLNENGSQGVFLNDNDNRNEIDREKSENVGIFTGDLESLRFCEDHALPFKYFCEKHKTVLCEICEMCKCCRPGYPLDEDCPAALELEKVVTGCISTEEELSDEFNEILSGLSEEMRGLREKECGLKTDRQTVVGKLKKLRCSVDSLLDKLEMKVTEEIYAPIDAKLAEIAIAKSCIDEALEKANTIRHLKGRDKFLAEQCLRTRFGQKLDKIDSEFRKTEKFEIAKDHDELNHQCFIHEYECMTSTKNISKMEVDASLSFADQSNVLFTGEISVYGGSESMCESLAKISSNAELEDARDIIFDILEAGTDFGLAFHTTALFDPNSS